ncbi:MAG: hypothetical protein COA38_01435 [Fluviicola sp.]|nr:MAG: hypothetical protein COA38_01435 [Fluviicola sp.]
MLDQIKLKRYDELVAQCDRFERKGKTVPYTSANGHMFSLFNKADEVGIRFSKEVQEKYIEQFDSNLYHSHKAVMKGYVLIPEIRLKDDELIVQLLNESYDYVMSLPGK